MSTNPLQDARHLPANNETLQTLSWEVWQVLDFLLKSMSSEKL